MSSKEICPCGSDKGYKNCCSIPHQNIAIAVTSEQLMHSRYTAFVLGKGDFLMISHHSMTRSHVNISELIRWAQSMKWMKLEIIKTQDGGPNDESGIVEFKAHFKSRGKKEVLHQRGKFIREYGNWVYFGLE